MAGKLSLQFITRGAGVVCGGITFGEHLAIILAQLEPPQAKTLSKRF